MAANKKTIGYIGEEPYILRVRDPELANEIRSTLRDEKKIAESGLEIIFTGKYSTYPRSGISPNLSI